MSAPTDQDAAAATDPDRNVATKMPPWTFRRRWSVRTLLFCAGTIVYAMWQGPEMTAVVLPTMATLGGGILVSYGVIAAYHDTQRGS